MAAPILQRRARPDLGHGELILAGGPTREISSDLYCLHRDSLKAQTVDCRVMHELVPDPGGPRWHDAKIEEVAKARQRFLDDQRPLFMVDSDVVCGPHVLERLMAVDADVVYGVFWSNWPGFDDLMPQVWDVHYYGHSPEMNAFMDGWKALGGPVMEYDVLGGGACTLIRGRGHESRYHPRLESLGRIPGRHMWGGEDRSYCLGLECRDIRQVAVFGLPIYHLNIPRYQTPEHLAKIRKEIGL